MLQDAATSFFLGIFWIGLIIGAAFMGLQYLYGKAQQSELGRQATQRLGEAAADALKKKLGQ